MSDLQERVSALEAAANAVVLERSTEVACVVNALVSRSHVFIQATPGVAKTFLAKTVRALIGGLGPEDFFRCTLGAYSDPSELLGPFDPRALKQGRFERNTAHRLPRARFAHVGEIWEAPPGSLNYLLDILHEREFANGEGDVTPVPLATLVCDSNHTPEQNPRLQALWDRIAFRLVSRPIQGQGARMAMLRAADERHSTTGSTSTPLSEPVLEWADIEAAQAEAREVAIPDQVYEVLLRLFADLADAGIVVSERRQVACLPIVKAQAWRAGRDEAALVDMALLSHVLWSQRDEIPAVQKLVFGLASPRDAMALAIADSLDLVAATVGTLEGQPASANRRRLAIESMRKVHDLAERLKTLKDEADVAVSRLDLFDPLSARMVGLSQRLDPLV